MVRRVIKSGVEGREQLALGAEYLAKAVASTLGPHGHNWFLDKKNTITNDGISVAREIQLVDEVQNRGAAAIREAGQKTVDEAGDGTSTAIWLAYAIYKEASRYLGKEGVLGKLTSAQVSNQIEKERLEVTEKLKAMATPIETKEQLVASATVSTEDPELGKLIGDAQWELGPNGYLLAETTAERTSSIERVKGIRIDNGFGTSQLINNQEKQTLEVEKASLLLTSLTMRGKGEWEHVMKNILEPAMKSGIRDLVIVARAWTDDTVKFCMANIQQGSLNIYPLSAPYVNMSERMKDLAAITGARFYDAENSDFGDMLLTGLGFTEKVTAKRNEAILVAKDDAKTEERVANRVAELKKELEGEKSEFAKKQLLERIAQLENGFALVKVGSPSDMERQRLFDKAEDAVNAVRAAYQEGTVPGAGMAFKTIAEGLPDDYLLKRPLMSIYEQIKSSAPADFEVEDWVRDPAKVMRVALEKACAAASSFATAGGVITQEFPKPINELFKQGQTE